MADNITLNSGSGGAVVATDDDATAHHQYVKVEFGGDGTFTKVTTAVGLPTDPLDRAARDMGKVDVAALDQYTPVDVDSGAGSENALPVSIRIAASGASIAETYNTGTVGAGTQRVTLATDVALPAGTNAIGKLAANSGVDIGDVDVTSIAAGDNNIGNVDIVSLPASTNTIEVVGDAAHDAAVAGNPLRIGAKAESSPKGITLVADGDATDLHADLDGVLIAKLDTANGDIINERVSNTDGSSTAFTNFSAVASTRNYIKTVVVHNAHATTNGFVDIRDGTAGTILATIPAPATGGAVVNFDPPLRSTANTAMAFDVSAAITTVYITATGWQSKA